MINQVSCSLKLAWQQSHPNAGTGDTVQQGQMESTLGGINVDEWDQLYHDIIEVGVATDPTTTINLLDLINELYEVFAFDRVLTLFVRNLGDDNGAGNGVAKIRPGATNPCRLFFADDSDAILLPVGRAMIVKDSITAVGTFITSTTRNIQVDYVSGDNCLVEIAIYGSTSVTGETVG